MYPCRDPVNKLAGAGLDVLSVDIHVCPLVHGHDHAEISLRGRVEACLLIKTPLMVLSRRHQGGSGS